MMDIPSAVIKRSCLGNPRGLNGTKIIELNDGLSSKPCLTRGGLTGKMECFATSHRMSHQESGNGIIETSRIVFCIYIYIQHPGDKMVGNRMGHFFCQCDTSVPGKFHHLPHPNGPISAQNHMI